ncbi:MAG: cell envelope integrity protein TolA [Burkholderiales bacterium]
MAKPERPRQPRRTTGKWWALLLAVIVQLGFLAVLVFSVQWQSRKPEPVTAELYAPPVKAPVVEPAPVPPPPPPPEPEPEPKPAPPPKPAPVVEKPDPRAAEIALKAKQEEERRRKVEAERKAEAEKKAREAKEAEEKRRLDEKRAAEAKERQQRETAALRAQAERETRELRAQAERDAQRQAADASARSKAEADWIRRIQAKVKGNVIVPADLPGNPEAIFEVVQLPTGEIIDTKVVKSSGNRAYDDAVQRAILKSSPLPRPDRADLFQRTLTLKFRPSD